MHTCARLSPDGVAIAALGQARPDIIAFDAYQGLEVFCADPAAQDFLRTGGWVAWGLVPTWPRLDQLDPQALFARWLGAATGVMAVEAVARQTLITATCGLGLPLNQRSPVRSTWPISSLSRLPRSHRQRPKRRRLGRETGICPQCLCTLAGAETAPQALWTNAEEVHMPREERTEISPIISIYQELRAPQPAWYVEMGSPHGIGWITGADLWMASEVHSTTCSRTLATGFAQR